MSQRDDAKLQVGVVARCSSLLIRLGSYVNPGQVYTARLLPLVEGSLPYVLIDHDVNCIIFDILW